MITAQEALSELKFKSISSMARVLLQKFPQRRQGKIKANTKLTSAEVNTLRQFKNKGYVHEPQQV